MNLALILLLASFGLIMGVLAVNGYTHKIEPFLWLLFAVITALVISRNVSTQVFLHGFSIGLLWGILNGLTQCLFFSTYLANNPAFTDNFNKITFMPARFFPLLTGPVIGSISGLVLGGLCLLAKKIA